MLLALALVGSAAVPADGQEALVLSTGASRGFSHAGAILALDSLGYDPDIVVGASMGAVIGALYATGLDPRLIVDLILASDWGDLFKPLPLIRGPTREVRFPLLSVGINLRAREVTRGFVPAWRVNRLLTHLLFEAGAAVRSDFDRLPRRFRAVGADLGTGEEVLLDRGDLARAVRVSMGTPGIFAPVEWNGRILTDGGVANYLPISVAKEMGADYVVAVDASRPDPEIGRRDPPALSGRAIGLLMRNAVDDTVADVLVEPDIPTDFSGAIFSGPKPLIRLGLQAGRDAPVRARDTPSPLPPTPVRSLLPAPDRFSGLRVEVDDPGLERLTRRLFGDLAPGPYAPELVLARVDRLYATGLVSGVWPRVEENEVLVVRVDPLPRTSLSAAIGYDNDRGGRIWGDVQQRLPVGSPVEANVAVTMADLERWVAAGLHVHSLRWPLSWTLGAHYRETDTRVFDQGEFEQRDTRRIGGWIGAELHRIYPDWVATVAVQAERVEVEDSVRGLSAGPFLRVTGAPPPSIAVGGPAELEASLRLGGVGYGTASLRTSRNLPLPRVLTAAVLEGSVTVGGAPVDVLPALGDRHAMPGLRWDEEAGRGTLLAGLDLARPFMTGSLRTRIRAGVAADAWGEAAELDEWIAGAALEGLWSLPFGPIVIGVGANTTGSWRADVQMGPVF